MDGDQQAPAQPAGGEGALLGPFLGQVTPGSIRLWLHLEGGAPEVFVTVHRDEKSPPVATTRLAFRKEKLWTDCVTLEGLQPNTRYAYRLWTNPAHSIPLNLQGLTTPYLRFRTLPADPNARIDFVLMSCHNPFDSDDGCDGHAVWVDLLQVVSHENNQYVRFAVLGGDQVYSDEFKAELLAERDDAARPAIYLKAYRKFWSNIHYRRVMAGLPAVMIWDDHEIIDGWGSDVASFKPGTTCFKDEWAALFRSASSAFAVMQASRNPPLLSNDAFDCCFRVGKVGFALLDLRTNRNLLEQRIMSDAQFDRFKAWMDANKPHMHTLFVVSPVVFSHGPPVVERLATRRWKYVLTFFELLARFAPWGKGIYARFDQSSGTSATISAMPGARRTTPIAPTNSSMRCSDCRTIRRTRSRSSS